MAIWKIFGDPLLTADMTGKTATIRFKPNKNIVFRACKTWLIIKDPVGDIAFSDICGKIYSDRGGVAGGLIATSNNTFDKTDLLSVEDQGVLEPWFEFDDVSLQKDTWYHFVLNCAGYTYDPDKHIAWRKAWPDPVYRTNLPITFEALNASPYFLVVIGDEL